VEGEMFKSSKDLSDFFRQILLYLAPSKTMPKRGTPRSFRRHQMAQQQTKLAQELVSLFDLRKSKVRIEKELSQAAYEAQRDIRYLTLMFSDGIPDIAIKCTDTESIKWDSRAQSLLYVHENGVQLLEATAREIRIKMRPYLTGLVVAAKVFYSDECEP
jgi:hypothetical protein